MPLFDVSKLGRPGLSNISLALNETELVCLSGPSGAGKTLLLRALVDLDVNSGDVTLEGTGRNSMAPELWRSRVAYLPAESRWWAATVGEHFPARNDAWLTALGFDSSVYDWSVERLSSGERQRLALLRLLANRPRVLLLDEPTANLDPENTGNVESLVREYLDSQRAACLWVTHAAGQKARIAGRSLVLDKSGLREAAPA